MWDEFVRHKEHEIHICKWTIAMLLIEPVQTDLMDLIYAASLNINSALALGYRYTFLRIALNWLVWLFA